MGSVNYQLGPQHPNFEQVMALVELTSATLRMNLKVIAPELTQVLILVADGDNRAFVQGTLTHARAMIQTGLPGMWESDQAEAAAAVSKALDVLERTAPKGDDE